MKLILRNEGDAGRGYSSLTAGRDMEGRLSVTIGGLTNSIILTTEQIQALARFAEGTSQLIPETLPAIEVVDD